MNDMKCTACGCEITENQTALSACGARLHTYEIDDKTELCESCHDELSICDWCGIAVDENVPMIDVHDGSRICPFCARGEDRSERIFDSEITPEYFCPACKSRFYPHSKQLTYCCHAEHVVDEEGVERCSECRGRFGWDETIPVCPACGNSGSGAYIQPDYEGCFHDDEKEGAVIFVRRGQDNQSIPTEKPNTMATIIIRGSSDDLIEIEGDIRDEFGGGGDEKKYLHFSDGTIVAVDYYLSGEGWTCQIEKLGDGTTARQLAPILDDDGTRYSERLELTGDIESVATWGLPSGPSDEDVEQFWEYFDPNEWAQDQLRAAFIAMQELA